MSENTNIKAGDCIDCGNYWTVTSSGLNDAEQCPECERKYSAAPVKSAMKVVECKPMSSL